MIQKVELVVPKGLEYSNGNLERDLMRTMNYDSAIIDKYKSERQKEQPKKRVRDDQVDLSMSQGQQM